jgi:zinc D-Ala-D-Ala carboxypeptidase
MVKKLALATSLALITVGFIAVPLAGAQPTLNPTVLIDKSHPLAPRDYAPPELVVPQVFLAELPANDPEMQLAPLAGAALTKMLTAAESDGLTLVLSSGYRSYNDQAALYAGRLSTAGLAANEAVARPSYSEHQSGLAADIIPYNYFCAAQGCFALSRAAAWLDQNSYKYGFIVRYPLHKETSTGYEYEPWHLRYVGIPLAERLHASGQTLEEFYGLP